MELSPVHVKKRRWLQDGIFGGCAFRFRENDRHHGIPSGTFNLGPPRTSQTLGPRQAVHSVLGSARHLKLSGLIQEGSISLRAARLLQ